MKYVKGQISRKHHEAIILVILLLLDPEYLHIISNKNLADKAYKIFQNMHIFQHARIVYISFYNHYTSLLFVIQIDSGCELLIELVDRGNIKRTVTLFNDGFEVMR